MNAIKNVGIIVLAVFFGTIAFSCSPEESSIINNPVAEHNANPLGSDDAPYGYYVYLPSNYVNVGEAGFPTLIFLHGVNEIGNSSYTPEILDRVLNNGPPKMIENGQWNPSQTMLVFSPQCHEGNWKDEKLKMFIEYVISNYKVDVRRIYLTGLSMGGYGTFNYIGKYADESFIAAAVPICGGGKKDQAESFKNIPLWAFHGDADDTVSVSNSIDMVKAINNAGPALPAKLTIFPGVGHNSWDMTYDGSGMGKESAEYDPFNQSIYDWMLQYKRID